MTYVLDTNTCIQFLNGKSATIRSRIESTRPEDMVVCSVVRAELFYGVAKSARPAQNLERLSRFLHRFPTLPFDDAAAETYGTIRSQLERAGTPIGTNDMLIAAIALARGRIVVTHNGGEFGRVQGLRLEDWE